LLSVPSLNTMGSDEEEEEEEPKYLGELALFGDLPSVERRLGELGGDRQAVNDEREFMNGWAPLLLAARGGHAAVVDALCAGGAEVDWPNQGGGWTALHRAAFEGHETCVRALVARGAAVDKLTEFGNCALHWAAENGHGAVVRALLELGATPHLFDYHDLTPWHWAEQAGHSAVADLIGEPPPPPPEEPEETRSFAKLAQLGDLAGVQRRLAQCVDPNDEREFSGGNSPLYWAACGGHSAVVDALCAAGAATDWKDPISGMTPLHRAAALGQDAAVAALLEGGAPIDATDTTPTPCTPLHDAAMRGRDKTEEALLGHGADAATRAKLGDLVFNGDVVSVRQRLAQGADPDDPAECKSGQSPLYWAVFKGYVEIIEVLWENGAAPVQRPAAAASAPSPKEAVTAVTPAEGVAPVG
jgi:ankyrin repeat protein